MSSKIIESGSEKPNSNRKGELKWAEFFNDSDKHLFSTIEDDFDVPSEMEEHSNSILPCSKYNGSELLISQKGHIKPFDSDKTILSLNVDSQKSINFDEHGHEDYSVPLCAHRGEIPDSINRPDDINQSVSDEDELYELSESSVFESIQSILSSRRSKPQY